MSYLVFHAVKTSKNESFLFDNEIANKACGRSTATTKRKNVILKRIDQENARWLNKNDCVFKNLGFILVYKRKSTNSSFVLCLAII